MPDLSPAARRRACDLLLSRPPGLGPVRLGVVDGPSGSGKTTFAAAWARELRGRGAGTVEVFGSDLLATWDDPFDWWPAFAARVLDPLSRGEPGRVQVMDWTGGTPHPGPWRTVPVPSVLILEGVSTGRRAVARFDPVLVWVEVPDRAERLDRAVARDGEHTRPDFRRWQQAEDAFFAADRTRERAAVVLCPGG
ncbi:uridine kinase family protein [Nakamurella flava]|uniref:uridine kinase family protein n=1 Tax=Nakamurella flava TaxID=2576308 RepID=UPI00197C6E76|nr:uridine kinase [Nakamurella flava]